VSSNSKLDVDVNAGVDNQYIAISASWWLTAPFPCLAIREKLTPCNTYDGETTIIINIIRCPITAAFPPANLMSVLHLGIANKLQGIPISMPSTIIGYGWISNFVISASI
jgi:hypothetical protein